MDCDTLVSTRGRDAEYFQIRVGLHQGPVVFVTHHGCKAYYRKRSERSHHACMGDVLLRMTWSSVNTCSIEQKSSFSQRDGERRFSHMD